MKFQVGDKVRLTVNVYHGNPKGSIGTIYELKRTLPGGGVPLCPYRVRFGGQHPDARYFMEDELELVAPALTRQNAFNKLVRTPSGVEGFITSWDNYNAGYRVHTRPVGEGGELLGRFALEELTRVVTNEHTEEVAVSEDIEALRREVFDLATKAADKHGWCGPGRGEVFAGLAKLGITAPEPKTVRVVVEYEIPRGNEASAVSMLRGRSLLGQTPIRVEAVEEVDTA